MKTHQKELGFTRVDLLAVIATVALLAFSVIGDGHIDGEGEVCKNNMRQMIRAQFLYAADHGYFPPNPSDNQMAGSVWVRGNSGFNTVESSNATFVANSMLSPYLDGNVSAFRCPSDPFTVFSGKLAPRVRTVSMNHAVGTDPADVDGPCKRAVPGFFLDPIAGHTANAKFRCYARPSDIANPAPANLFIFLDEHSDSINDGLFVSMGPTTSVGALQWLDIPAAYHNGQGSFAFADGHADLHRWAAPFTQITRTGFPVTNPGSAGQRADLQWLAEHTTALRAQQP